jgi:hypothetical protein
MNIKGLVSLPFMIAGMAALNGQISVWAAEPAKVEMLVMIRKPATPKELLENIKWGMEQNVFLREDFYTEQNIRRVLGDYPFRWEANDPKRKYLTIETNAQPLPSSDPNHRCILGAVLSWGIKSGGGPAPLAKLQIGVALKHDDPSCVSFSADLIQDLFGKPTKVESIFPPGRPPPHGRVWVPGPTVHPLGNTDIEYVLGGGAVSKRMTFEIRGNGVVVGLSLFMEQN